MPKNLIDLIIVVPPVSHPSERRQKNNSLNITIPISTIATVSTLRAHPYLFDPLMRDIVGHFRKPSSYVVFLYLWFRTSGGKKSEVPLSLREISDGCGLSKSSVQTSIRYLQHRRLLEARRTGPTTKPRYTVHEPWKSRRMR